MVIDWMMDETTSRSAEKSCIIYVRYMENFESKTSYYGLLELDGDGTANNIVKSLVRLWEQDGINPANTCWIASDNAPTFTIERDSIYEGVVAKLKQLFSIEYIESSPCMAHSFALVDGQKPIRAPCIEKLESTIGEIHNYFGRSPITKSMQHDHLSYFNLMDIIKEKQTVLNHCRSESTSIMGPTLTSYIEATELGSFGSFKIKLGDRVMFFNDCRKHIQRLLQELDKRFKPSIVQEHLSMLFDVQHLIKNKNELDSIEYGRRSLDILRKKYKNLPDFDYNLVKNEWESFKPVVFDYKQSLSYDVSEQQIWKYLITFKLSTNNFFIDEYKNIFILLNVYLIYPTNSVECERGLSAMSRNQSIGRSRLSIPTLQVLMAVRLLLKDDIRRKDTETFFSDTYNKDVFFYSVRCQQIVEKAFLSWIDKDHSRRLRQVQLLTDVPVGCQPTKQARSVAKRNLSIMNLKEICKKI
ncbi:unnamed protein product [Rotaria sp. Silwood1]|nr:unnamed protein product [Rotaria sp. Silwood1]CAF3839869.1 unnamed protein product [Rotaria sp. Silwood1]CAF4866771.1 unnamed protein product [Rotaria sp. Silwood1]